MISYKQISEFNRGIILSLLINSYNELILKNPIQKDELIKQWKILDSDSFDYLNTIGSCVRISCENDKPIGMFSWDLRKLPEEGIVGQNCIIPEQRNKGNGKKQIEEIINLFKMKNARKITITTAKDIFFLPAHKMYQSCGFKEVKGQKIIKNNIFELIRFELKMC